MSVLGGMVHAPTVGGMGTVRLVCCLISDR